MKNKTNIFKSLRLRLLSFIVLAAVIFGTFSYAVPVRAQTTSSDPQLVAMMQQIQQLMQILAALQARIAVIHGSGSQNSVESGFSNYGFSVNDRVQTTDTLKVRSWAEPGAGLVGVQNPFAGGKITGGPQVAGGYTWWQVNYDNGMLGWSAQNWLRKVISTPPPTPTPTPDDSDDAEEADEQEEEEAEEVEDGEVVVDVYVEDTEETLVITNDVTNEQYGEFEIEFEVTAAGDDIYVYRYQSAKDGSLLPEIEDGQGNTVNTGTLSFTLESNARKSGSFFKIADGDTETIKLVAEFSPNIDGTYKLVLDKLPYVVGQAGGSVVYVDIDDGETNSLNIEGELDSDEDNLIQMMEALLSQLAISSSQTDPTAAELADQATNLAEQIGGTKEDEYKDRIEEFYSTDIPPSHAVIDPDADDEGDLGSYTIKVNDSTVESSSARSYTRSEVMDKCEDVVRDNPSAQISCKFMSERIYDTHELTVGGQPAVDLISKDQSFTEHPTDPGRNYGDFEVTFEITAEGADVLVPAQAVMVGDQSDRHLSVLEGPQELSWLFQVEGELGGIIEPDVDGYVVMATVDSNAEELVGSGKSLYKIEEGDTEEFTLHVSLDPGETDSYRVILGNYSMYYFTEGSKFYDQIFFLTTRDFRTSYEFVPNEVVPERNAFSCSRNSDGQYSNGELACYGVWDYGNSFGNDHDMCDEDGEEQMTGCVIDAPVCESGLAEATTYYSNKTLEGMSSSVINTIANNLETSTRMVQQEMAGLWEYECVPAGTVQGASTTNLSQQFNDALAALNAALAELMAKIK